MSNTATISQGQEILALQDELTGALIGLARSCGNNPKTENTDEIIIEGLVHTITNSNIGAAALKAMIEKVREEKNTVAPDCTVCAAPCGNTSEYDVSNIWKHETDVRGVETAILFGIREMAAIIYPAVIMGKTDAEVNEFSYKALCMISYGNGIGMVHQHFKLVPSLTVYENILLGAEITQKKGGMKTPFIDQKEEIKRVEKLIQENHLELNATDKIEDISVGGRQRVEILKMLYRNVDILILDEPTAVLTPQEVDELIATLKNLKEQGKTIIVITHKLREVMELADSITVIKQGKVVGNVLKKDTSERELAQMMVGRDVVLTVNNARKQQVESEIMYKAENLTTVNDYGKEVVSDMSFEVHKGEILGIAGVEGNGQSELVKLMTGLMESTRGTVFFDGKDITNWWPEKLRKAGIGIIPEDRYALVPSRLIAAIGIIKCPSISSCIDITVPILTATCIPDSYISSIAIAADGAPIPVDVTVISTPL